MTQFAEPVNNDPNHFCFAWFGEESLGHGARRAALSRKAMWPTGAVITVSFLDGDTALHDKVAEAAQLWTAPGLANLTLSFRADTRDTHVRISFKQPGSWSIIGTTCKTIKDHREPTMNFGWLKSDSPEDMIERVVLHEFGHALGLIHEHQHPKNGIHWNKDAVFKALSGPGHRWSPQQIETNMFKAFSEQETNFSTFDPLSIMMYPFPADWTTDGFSTGLNKTLSPTDKKFIHEQYP